MYSLIKSNPVILLKLAFASVTPSDYEPPGFRPAEEDCFKFEDEPMHVKVGDVATVSFV